MVALAAAIVAPIGEELFFRGFALTAWLRDLWGRAPASFGAPRSSPRIHILNITPTTSFAEGAGQAVLQSAVIFPVGLVLGLADPASRDGRRHHGARHLQHVPALPPLC